MDVGSMGEMQAEVGRSRLVIAYGPADERRSGPFESPAQVRTNSVSVVIPSVFGLAVLAPAAISFRNAAILVTALLVLAAAMQTSGARGAVVLCAIFAASLITSIAGFAFSAVCGAILLHVIDAPVRVIQMLLLCSIANQLFMTWSLRGAISWRTLAPFLVGGIVGLPVGLYILFATSRTFYIDAFGALLILYGAYKLVHPMLTLPRQHVGWDVLAGMLGGVTGGSAAFPSAFVTIWCSFKGWDKDQQRAVYQPFILFMQFITIAAITCVRSANAIASTPATTLALADFLCVPAGLLGTWCGMACFARLNDRQFALAVNLLLLVSGLSFIF